MRRTAHNHRVTISPVVSAAQLLAAAGIDPLAIALQAGLASRDLARPESTITYAELGRYLNACIAATGDEAFALRVGIATGPAGLKTLGFLALNTANVRGALATLAKQVHQFAGTIEIAEDQGLACFDYAFFYPALDGGRAIVDTAIGVSIATLRALSGPAWLPNEVRMTRSLPERPEVWKRLLQAPVYFAAERNLIVFQSRWLDQPVERADPELRRLLLDKLAELDARGNASDVERIATLIRSCVLADEPTLEQVSGRLAISTATLKRRLKAASTSFQGLLDQTRFAMACQLLQDSKASMAQITDVLGYKRASTFSRAFARWAGMPPRQWRATHRPASASEPMVK